ncbi:MAG: radical SAM protein, partial [Bacteroidota bacterium]
LTGVNIGDFGNGGEVVEGIRPKKEAMFIDLIRELDKVEGIERFRISSIEPNLCSDEIIEFVAYSNRFVPHFHMPLQSGNNKQLKSMRRRYKRELYAERVRKIKSLMPHCCIGVDVIVGFPGETEEDFLETYRFLNELDISYLHVFTYSERNNTLAAQMQGVVSIEDRRKRNKMLTILSDKKRRHFYEQHLGETRPVLFEASKTKGKMSGFTDNYVKVEVELEEALLNQIEELELSEINESGLVEGKVNEYPLV